MKKYDIIVIGAGPAGMAVSSFAGVAGLKVLVIDGNRIGGECLNCGCMPSKSLLKAAEVFNLIKNADQYGINIDNGAKVGNVLKIIRDNINNKGRQKASSMFKGVDTLIGKGYAKFKDAHVIEVEENLFYGKKIFIATGSNPFIPNIKGMDKVPFLTNRNVFEVDQMPDTLTIVGGGAIACELAQAFSRFSTHINIINMDSHLIPTADEDISYVLENKFRKDGIKFYNSTLIRAVAYKDGNVYIYTDKDTLISEMILIAAGRVPAIHNLNLKEIQVEYDESGIIVDQNNRTSRDHIYAVGDCNGKSTFSHSAMHQGMLSVMHLLNFKPSNSLQRILYPTPWTIFTDPEIAHVGISEKEAKEKGISYMIMKDFYENYGRAMVDKKPEGFVKVITNEHGKILGASIIGNGAGEMISEWTMAIQYGLSVEDVAMMQHPFPTLSLMNGRVAQMWMMKTAGGYKK